MNAKVTKITASVVVGLIVASNDLDRHDFSARKQVCD
jgi:hypothetical protein